MRGELPEPRFSALYRSSDKAENSVSKYVGDRERSGEDLVLNQRAGRGACGNSPLFLLFIN